MEVSLMLAWYLGAFMTVAGLALLLNPKRLQKMAGDYMKNDGLIWIGGILALLIGLIIVRMHNVWEQNWTVLITIFGWLALVKGLCLMLCPDCFQGWMKWWMAKDTTKLVVAGLIYLVLGLFLFYKAWGAY